MKNIIKSIFLILLIMIIIIKIPVKGFSKEDKAILGIVNGLEFSGDDMFWEYIESNKMYIAERLYREFGDEGKSNYILELKENFRETVMSESRIWAKLALMIEDGYLEEESIKNLDESEIKDFILEKYYKFLDDKFSISEKELKEYKKLNPEKILEYNYIIWEFENLEYAEKFKKFIEEESLVQRIIEDINDEYEKENLAEEFQRVILLKDIKNKVGSYGEFYHGEINILTPGFYDNLYYGENTYLDEDIENILKEFNNIELGELSQVLKLDENMENYSLLIPIKKDIINDEDLKDYLKYERIKQYEEENLEDRLVKIVYPDFEKDLDKFDIYKNGLSDILVGKVDGKEIYLRSSYEEKLNYYEKNDSERNLKNIKKYLQNEEILDYLKREEAIKRKLFTEEELDYVDLSWEYRKRFFDKLKIHEKDLLDYKKDRTLNQYKVFRYLLDLEDMNEEDISLVRKDNNLVKIAKIFSRIYQDDDYKLSKDEEDLLKKLKSDYMIGISLEEFTNTQFEIEQTDEDIFFIEDEFKKIIDKEAGEILIGEDGIFDIMILMDKKEIDKLNPLIEREIKLYKYEKHIDEILGKRKIERIDF